MDSNVATVTITVNPVNDAPVAVDDAYATDEDTALNVAAPGVLTNDTDVDGDTLTAVLVVGPTNGTLTLNGDGSFIYTPNANFNGSDTFTYKANDGTADSNVATVTITVNPVNDAPVAVDDAYTTDEDTALNIAAPGVLTNDTDIDGDTMTAVLVVGPTNGTLTLNGDGSFIYTPNAGFNGSDSFTYRASDGTLLSNIATVTLNVGAVNEAPVAVDDAYTTDEDTALNIAAPGVLTNDTDIDGDTLTAVLVVGPTNGTLTLATSGSFTYTPDAGFNGSDSFTYKANDGTADSNVATVTITVNPVNDAPVAVNDAYATDEDTALNVAAWVC
ncbi:MAG: tandem-95 repeat protein [Chloroflexi bacterium]|nr:tandem-95 repeat protein [Chloroflexota bacterium]